MSFQERIAVITGGAGALGKVVARTFVESGASVAIPYRPAGGLFVPPAELSTTSSRVFFREADLTSEESVHTFINGIQSDLGPIDILVNAAGGFAGGTELEHVSFARWKELLDMNLTSVFLMCKAVLPMMKKRNFGRIVSIASRDALDPRAGRASYGVSKRGVVTLTEAVAQEVKGTGITVNAIAPSIILTPANKASMPDADSSQWVAPGEIASLIVYLCSADARSINGNVIRIYGGV